MNSWGYLILILALLAIAGIMLYARFASRSREKSLHHPPGEIDAVPEITAPVAEVSEPVPDDTIPAESPVELPAAPEISAKRIAAGEEATEDGEYLDELQEAAAGLAMLMRSSPVVDRTEPVVFAPEAEAEVEAEAVAEEAEGAIESEVGVSREGENRWECPNAEAAIAEAAPEEPEEEVEPVVEEDKIAIVLGEEIRAQFGEIDSGLDALEDLVASIETQLDDLHLDDPESPGEGSGVSVVGEAA